MSTRKLWKPIGAAATALVIAGSAVAYAQQRPVDRAPDGPGRWRPSIEDMRAFGEARLAALKAGLTLTPDQEKNWPAFEQAARDFAKQRLDAWTARRNAQPATDPLDRMHQRADAMLANATSLKRLVDATDPLYRSLDESQKRRFMVLAGRMGAGLRGGMRAAWRMHRHEGRPGMELYRDGGDGPRRMRPDRGPEQRERL